MELMTTPRASAIPSISGAAVPEEILSTRVRARAWRTRGADALVRCNAGCIWDSGMRHGDAMRQIYLPGPRTILRTGRGSRAPIESRLGDSLIGRRRSGKLKAKLITGSPELPAFAMVI